MPVLTVLIHDVSQREDLSSPSPTVPRIRNSDDTRLPVDKDRVLTSWESATMMNIQTLQTQMVKPDKGSQQPPTAPSANKQRRDKSSKSGLQRLSVLSLDHLDRKDSYFQSKPTVSEKKEWLLQSIVPLLGLLCTLFMAMMIYEIPTTTSQVMEPTTTTYPTNNELANPESTFEGCLRFNDFHRYLDRPEEDETFYCDADMIPKKNQSIRN